MDMFGNVKDHFINLVQQQLDRVEEMKKNSLPIDYSSIGCIVIGIVGGDGIGPFITKEALRVLEFMLAKELSDGKVKFKIIDGLTIENRIREMAAIPPKILEEIKSCHVILKGPTTTPEAGSDMPNLESANVRMRKELDLFANVRPVCVPELGIDWCFFRENTEGAYALGSQGINVSDDLAIDFTVTTTQGTERIARAAFEYAKKNGKKKVTVVTKANVIKATDGKFLTICQKIAKEYEGIKLDSWYADILTAKLIDEKRRREFEVLVLPNLYGDIITDEAAEFQGGVGTAGGANIGNKYAMFEAIHGSAPRMVSEGRAQFADPRSMLRAVQLLLSHIGFYSKSKQLGNALDNCRCNITGRSDGESSSDYTDRLIDSIR